MGARASTYAIAAIVQKASALLLLPLYTRIMAPEDYGYLNLFVSYVLLVTVVAQVGLDQAVVRFCSGEVEKRLRAEIYTNVLFVVAAWSLVVACISMLALLLAASIVFPGLAVFPSVPIVVASGVLLPIISVHLAYLQSRGRAKSYVQLSLGVFFVNAALTVAFVGPLSLGIPGIALATLATYVAASGIVVERARREGLLSAKWSRAVVRDLLQYSLPLLPHELSMQLTAFASRVAISKIVSVAALGAFNVAQSMAIVIDTIQNAIQRAFLPWFLGHIEYQEGRPEVNADTDVQANVQATILMNCIMSVAVGVLGNTIIVVMATEAYSLPVLVVPLLAVSMIPKGMYYSSLSVLLMDNRGTRVVLRASLVSSVIGVALCMALARPLGIVGAALGQLVQRSMIFVIAEYGARQLRGSIIPYRRIAASQIISVFVIFASAAADAGNWMVAGVHVGGLMGKLVLIAVLLLALGIMNRRLIGRLIGRHG